MSWSRTLKNRQQIYTRLESGTKIGVMFSDIRGFSSYTARQGDRAAYRLSRQHEALLKRIVEEHEGIVVKTMGDGIMAAFPTPGAGVQAAARIQQEIRSRNRQSPDPIDVGIGLACGTPVMSDEDLIGHSVNLSQRLSSLAKGGQILVTEQVRRSTSLPEGLFYLAMAGREMKGLGRKQIYEVVWMVEVSRLSDKENRLTLVLTERGTVVVKPAKALQGRMAGPLSGSKEDRKDLPALLKRVLSRFAAQRVDRSAFASDITREVGLDEVDLVPCGKDLLVRLGKKELRLRHVDPTASAHFLARLAKIRERREDPRTAPGQGRLC